MRALLLALLMLPMSAWAGPSVSSNKLFETDSVRLAKTDEIAKLVGQLGAWLKDDKERVVHIEVHCDERAGTIANTNIANLRAKALAKAVLKSGGRKKQVLTDAVGHSGVQPTAATHRIEFKFDGEGPALSLP